MSGMFLFGRMLPCIKSRILSKEPFNNSATSIAVRYFSVSQSRNMKLVQFTYNDCPGVMRVGYLNEWGIVDVNKQDTCLPTTLLDILRYGAFNRVKLIESQYLTATESPSYLRLEAPVTGQDKVLCIGLNYKDHCEEHKLKAPKVPMIFNKFASTVIGPNDTVKLRTDVTQKVDWEVELAVVIGEKASCVKAEDAYKYVLGYTVAQDISARDWQKERNSGQFLLGKAMDTFCPLGPWIVTCDEIPDPQCLDIRCSVNGVIKQSSNTCQLVHKIPDVIARLTSVMTLLPGDTILTGTPGGVGMYRTPPEYLQPGDQITSEIQCIGSLETKFVNYTL